MIRKKDVFTSEMADIFMLDFLPIYALTPTIRNISISNWHYNHPQQPRAINLNTNSSSRFLSGSHQVASIIHLARALKKAQDKLWPTQLGIGAGRMHITL